MKLFMEFLLQGSSAISVELQPVREGILTLKNKTRGFRWLVLISKNTEECSLTTVIYFEKCKFTFPVRLLALPHDIFLL